MQLIVRGDYHGESMPTNGVSSNKIFNYLGGNLSELLCFNPFPKVVNHDVNKLPLF